MTFSIKLLPDVVENIEEDIGFAVYGVITIGTFQEQFTTALSYWSVNDYEKHWKQALSRILYNANISCLITSMVDSNKHPFIFWWPMYRIENIIFIQNQILFFDQLLLKFNEQDPFSSVSERRILDDDENKISEWSVPVADIEIFYNKEYK